MLKRKKAYSIEKLYADCPSAGEESDPVEVQLKISLGFSDWCKFQAQPFYQKLIRYLDNVEIPKALTLMCGKVHREIRSTDNNFVILFANYLR